MNLTSIKTIKELFFKYDIRSSKAMGQNFLVNRKILVKIIESADLKLNDIILEVGPGIGTLTKGLAKKAKKVIAVEKDKRMMEVLMETLKEYPNVGIINKDILKFPISNFQFPKYKLVANIPYYLTSPLIRKFLEEKNQPEFMVLMVQKEVAQRICSKPPNMSLLSVSVQFYAEPEIISYIAKESFWPRPKVDSAIIKITPFKKGESANSKLFFKIAKAGFIQPRKQLANNLSKVLKKDKNQISKWLFKNNIQPKQRAETLTVEDWIALAKNFNL